METRKDIAELLVPFAEDLRAEELQLSSLQALIAAEISMKRQSLKLSQKQFAEVMNVSQGLVSKWESGETNFTLSTLVNIASKLNMKMQIPFVPEYPMIFSLSTSNILSFKSWVSNSAALAQNDYAVACATSELYEMRG